MEMHQVRYFLAVSRLLNFTRAAEECHVAQPSLTRAIKQLEHELGGDLFRRERNLTHLSDLGQRMLPLMEQCYASALAAKQMATSINQGDLASLTIAVPITLNIELLVPCLKELVQGMCGLTLKFLRGTSSDVSDQLKKGGAEVAVAPVIPERWERFESWPLFTESYCLVVAKTHPISKQSSVSIGELREERIICRPYCEDFERGVSFLADSGIDIPTAHHAGSEADFVALLEAGLGVGFAPASIAASPELSVLSVDGFDMERTVFAYAVAGRQRSISANTLLKMLRAADWSRLEENRKAA